MNQKKTVQKTKETRMNIRLDQSELDKIRKDAEKYYFGNLSGWVRHCCYNFNHNLVSKIKKEQE